MRYIDRHYSSDIFELMTRGKARPYINPSKSYKKSGYTRVAVVDGMENIHFTAFPAVKFLQSLVMKI